MYECYPGEAWKLRSCLSTRDTECNFPSINQTTNVSYCPLVVVIHSPAPCDSYAKLFTVPPLHPVNSKIVEKCHFILNRFLPLSCEAIRLPRFQHRVPVLFIFFGCDNGDYKTKQHPSKHLDRILHKANFLACQPARKLVRTTSAFVGGEERVML